LKLTRAVLVDVRTRSMRKNIWYRSLTKIERSLVNLTIDLVREVRSFRLSFLLERIVERVNGILEDTLFVRIAKEGRKLALRLSQLAHAWGNLQALEWVQDNSYALYLGLLQLNVSVVIGCSL
jgi:hypothetical protein